MDTLFIGIDPGSRILGYSIISFSELEGTCSLICSGVVRFCSGQDLGRKLFDCFTFLVSLVNRYQSSYNRISFVIEKSFYGVNVSSAFVLNSFYSIVLLVSEFTGCHSCVQLMPSEVKKLITGSGHASKEMVFLALKNYFPSFSVSLYDESDAVAVGLAGLLEETNRPPSHE